jgi:hypothetical protein
MLAQSPSEPKIVRLNKVHTHALNLLVTAHCHPDGTGHAVYDSGWTDLTVLQHFQKLHAEAGANVEHVKGTRRALVGDLRDHRVPNAVLRRLADIEARLTAVEDAVFAFPHDDNKESV